jgi:hypothetical protein
MEDDVSHHTSQSGEVQSVHYTHIAITAEQAERIRAVINEPGGHYNILFNNCAQRIERALNTGDVYGIPLGLVNIPAVLNLFVRAAPHLQ